MSTRRLQSEQIGIWLRASERISGKPDEVLNEVYARQDRAYAALETLFKAQALELFGREDLTVSEDFVWCPYELCEQDFELLEQGDHAACGFWFYSESAFTEQDVRTLAGLCQSAWSAGTGEVAPAVLAVQRYREWFESETESLSPEVFGL